MPVSPGDVVRIVAQQSDVNGSVIQNVFFYEASGTGSIPYATFMDAVEDELTTAYEFIEDYIPNTCDPDTLLADKVEFQSGKLVSIAPVGEIDWDDWTGGTGSGEGLPQGCSALVNFPTNQPGIQGRKYLGPLGEGTQNDGVLSSAVQTALASFAGSIIAGFASGTVDFEPVVMSTKAAAAIPLASSVINAVIAYQRRRKAGVGA